MSLDEVRQYYPNINIIQSGDNVQYVINQDDNATQFESQQIVLAEDQHILLNSENQIIIDQSQLQYTQTNQQFIVQENDVVTDYQPTEIVNSAPQQIYYTQPKQHVIQQQSTSILQRQILTRQPAIIHHAPAQMNNAEIMVQRGVQQQTVAPQRTVQQNVGVRLQYALQQPQNQTQQSQQIILQDDNQIVLVDGRYLTLAQYKQQLAQRNNVEKPQPQTQPYKPPPKRTYKRPNNNRGGGAPTTARGRARGVPQPPQSIPVTKPIQTYAAPIKSQLPQQVQTPEPVRGPQKPPPSLPQPQFQQRPQPLIPLSPHSQNGQTTYVTPNNSQSSSTLDDSSSSVSDEYRDSARMLVCLENGEQRLITFTLPKESCTVQDLLEQVGVPFNSDTKIECMSNPGGEIDYIVNVGAVNHSTIPVESQQRFIIGNKKELNCEPQECIVSQNGAVIPVSEAKPPPPPPPPPVAPPLPAEPPAEPEKPPEPPKILPKFIPGCLAVCNHCGYLSEDFNRCQRCKTRLPEDVKSINTKLDGKKDEKSPKGTPRTPGTRNQISPANQNPKQTPKPPRGAGKKKTAQEVEPTVVTLSSDDEDSSPKPIVHSPGSNPITIAALEKEPVITLEHNKIVDMDTIWGGGKEEDFKNMISTTLPCRTIRIGSYRFVPREEVGISSIGIRISVPVIGEPQQSYRLLIPTKYIIKVLGNFNKGLPVLFFYVTPSIGAMVRKNIKMEEGSEIYFDPLSKEDPYKRITLLPDNISEDAREIIRTIYSTTTYQMLEELSPKEANDILVRTCPRDADLKPIPPQISFTEIRQLLIYPPGKGGIAINAEDYMCLAQDQFLNDVIIDFYLKYLHTDVIASPMSEKVYIFSSFFYKRLTTKPAKASKRLNSFEVDSTMTPAEKRHCRVKSWTKNVNIFEKDYIIIPINENSHWFLAIICFPGLEGCRSMVDSNKIVKIPTKEKKKIAITIGNTTITTLNKEEKKIEKPIKCDEEEGSDRDEAEGDESELEESEEEEVIPEKTNKTREPIKQPCILIFDSLAGASRSRVVATLRDYLTFEHRAKLNSNKTFNKDNIKGACPKVPQQQNFTDCGLYVLQYVESFFKDPITDYHIPIKMLKNWFEEIVVTRKREDISNLIKDLMTDNSKDPSILPNIQFPTINGELVAMDQSESAYDEADGELEEEDDEEEDEGSTPEKENSLQQIAMQYTQDSGDEIPNTQSSVTATTTFVVSSASSTETKPATSETAKSNRDSAMSYLKSKRLKPRHKETDNKKQKME